MLRACHRVLKPGGLISFLVIAVADDLSEVETMAAVEAAPDHVAPGRIGYPALMEAAGFEAVEVTDVTDEYLSTLEDWIRAWEEESRELASLIGVDEFTERQTRRRAALRVVTRGLLVRYLISARRPTQARHP